MHEKYLTEKEKIVKLHENNSYLKEKVNAFLEEPNKKSAEQLGSILESERAEKNMERLLSLSEDVTFAENTLN